MKYTFQVQDRGSALLQSKEEWSTSAGVLIFIFLLFLLRSHRHQFSLHLSLPSRSPSWVACGAPGNTTDLSTDNCVRFLAKPKKVRANVVFLGIFLVVCNASGTSF